MTKNKREEWEKRLMDEFCVTFERAQDETVVERLESFIRSVRTQARQEERQQTIEEIKKRLKPIKYKTTPCPANPKFTHWVGKKGTRAICYQCGQGICLPKEKTLDDLLTHLTNP
jgi:hypothetical protein